MALIEAVPVLGAVAYLIAIPFGIIALMAVAEVFMHTWDWFADRR